MYGLNLYLFKDTLHGIVGPVFTSLRAAVRFERRELRGTDGGPYLLGSAPKGFICSESVVVNGLTGTRRLARPVRLSLAQQLGADIDGAWWPHTASVAQELRELIGVLHAPLGEIVDICINWSATEGTLDLNALVTGARSIDRPGPRRPRLMVVEGRGGCAKLLVVPYMTSQALGAMVMRCAAGLPALHSDRDSQMLATAHSVMSVAKAESAKWTGGMAATESLAAQALRNEDPSVEV